MRVIISDASSLILSQKVKLLEAVLATSSLGIPPEVYQEAVVKGKEKNAPDAYALEEKIRTKKIKVIAVKNTRDVERVMHNFRLEKGESEAIVVALEQGADHVLIDDHRGIVACKAYQLSFITTVTLVVFLVQQKTINKEDAQRMIQELAIYGRYKDELIFKALEEVNNHG